MTYRYQGKHYDCGSKAGFLEATVAYGLQHPEVGAEFREILLRVSQELSQVAEMEFDQYAKEFEAPDLDTPVSAILRA